MERILTVGLILLAYLALGVAFGESRKPEEVVSARVYEIAQKRIVQLERELGVAEYRIKECKISVLEPRALEVK